MHRLYFPRAEDLEFIDIDNDLAVELRALLSDVGHDAGAGVGFDERLQAALFAFSGTENLEERWSDDAQIERQVLDHLRMMAQDHRVLD